MTQYDILDRVARGLRAMQREPSAFLFIDEGLDWTWDREEICGIPVFHAVDLSCYWWGSEPDNCPFVPIGKTDGEITTEDRKAFSGEW